MRAIRLKSHISQQSDNFITVYLTLFNGLLSFRIQWRPWNRLRCSIYSSVILHIQVKYIWSGGALFCLIIVLAHNDLLRYIYSYSGEASQWDMGKIMWYRMTTISPPAIGTFQITAEHSVFRITDKLPVDSPHKSRWCIYLMFRLISAWMNY